MVARRRIPPLNRPAHSVRDAFGEVIGWPRDPGEIEGEAP
jgi:hypothetical protein